MKKNMWKILFIPLYLFTSSILLHVGVMAHDMPSDQSLQNVKSMPCHKTDNNSVDRDLPQEDCFETCMGIYDDTGGLVNVEIKDYTIYGLDTLITLLTVQGYDLEKYFLTKNDPPPLTRIGYARVGKEIRKME